MKSKFAPLKLSSFSNIVKETVTDASYLLSPKELEIMHETKEKEKTLELSHIDDLLTTEILNCV